jgi:hypothetical protein
MTCQSFKFSRQFILKNVNKFSLQIYHRRYGTYELGTTCVLLYFDEVTVLTREWGGEGGLFLLRIHGAINHLGGLSLQCVATGLVCLILCTFHVQLLPSALFTCCSAECKRLRTSLR